MDTVRRVGLRVRVSPARRLSTYPQPEIRAVRLGARAGAARACHRLPDYRSLRACALSRPERRVGAKAARALLPWLVSCRRPPSRTSRLMSPRSAAVRPTGLSGCWRSARRRRGGVAATAAGVGPYKESQAARAAAASCPDECSGPPTLLGLQILRDALPLVAGDLARQSATAVPAAALPCTWACIPRTPVARWRWAGPTAGSSARAGRAVTLYHALHGCTCHAWRLGFARPPRPGATTPGGVGHAVCGAAPAAGRRYAKARLNAACGSSIRLGAPDGPSPDEPGSWWAFGAVLVCCSVRQCDGDRGDRDARRSRRATGTAPNR